MKVFVVRAIVRLEYIEDNELNATMKAKKQLEDFDSSILTVKEIK